MLLSRFPRGWRQRGWWVAAGGALLLLLLPVPAPPPLTARLPHPPRKVAHMLADFSTHARLYPELYEWTIEEESGNYTAWQYTVSYRCGTRCRGRARVLALDEHAAAAAAVPQHAAAAAPLVHRVLVTHETCTQAPLFACFKICDKWDTETIVRSDGAGGSMLEERRAARGGWLRALWRQSGGGGGGGGGASMTANQLRQLLDML